MEDASPETEETAEDEFVDAQEVPEHRQSTPVPAEAEQLGEDSKPEVDSAAKPEDESAETQAVSTATAFPEQTPPALDACIVSFVDEAGVFYVQLTSDDESREALSEKLQDECATADVKVPGPCVGLACCAKFSEDEAWYRAVVEKVKGDQVTVRFVDFGNTDCVASSDLRELSAESLAVPPLAYRCLLEDCDADTVSSKLEDQILDQTLNVAFQTTESAPFTVNLQLEDGTEVSVLLTNPPGDDTSSSTAAPAVSEESVLDTAAVDPDRKCIALNVGHRMKVMVSHVESPSLFYVQRDEKLPSLTELSDNLFEHFSSLAEGDGLIPEVSVGQLCASQFGEEEEEKSWYRAQVKSIDSDADFCELFYIDFGNSDSVAKSSVRELPAEYQSLPWHCVACSLSGVQHHGQDWEDEASAAFEELVSAK
jgi:tudor domain-containing protein 1/4/6/7